MKNKREQQLIQRRNYSKFLWQRRDAFLDRCYKESSGVCILVIIGIVMISLRQGGHNGFLIAASLTVLTVMYGVVIHFIWRSVDAAYAAEIAESRRLEYEITDNHT